MFCNLDLYLVLSLLYGTQVYSFAAIPAICRLSLKQCLCAVFFIAAKLWAERSYFAVLLVFYNSRNLNCFGALFLRPEEEYWRSPFLNQFFWSEFCSGKWNIKNLEWFCCWTKWRVERKESGCLFISLVSREQKIEVWKKFCKRAIFFVHVRHFKAVFFSFYCLEFWLWFCLIFRLVVVVV